MISLLKSVPFVRAFYLGANGAHGAQWGQWGQWGPNGALKAPNGAGNMARPTGDWAAAEGELTLPSCVDCVELSRLKQTGHIVHRVLMECVELDLGQQTGLCSNGVC